MKKTKERKKMCVSAFFSLCSVGLVLCKHLTDLGYYYNKIYLTWKSKINLLWKFKFLRNTKSALYRLKHTNTLCSMRFMFRYMYRVWTEIRKSSFGIILGLVDFKCSFSPTKNTKPQKAIRKKKYFIYGFLWFL